MITEPERQVPTPPDQDRIVEATAQHPGMTQICRGGRCFQLGGVGPAVTAELEAFATDQIMKERIA